MYVFVVVVVVVVIIFVVTDLHATVDHIKIFSVAQHCFYGKCISLTTMQVIHTFFFKKIVFLLIFPHSHIKCKHCTEAKECSFAYDLLETYSLAKQIVNKFCSFCECCSKTIYEIEWN